MGKAREQKRAVRIVSTLTVWAFLLILGIDQPLTFATTTPIPENDDGPLLIWKEKAKYYLVIAVDQTGVPGTDLLFTVTDGKRVAKAFEDLGYLPLVKEQLIGTIADRGRVNAALKRIRDLPEWASVIIYYSGHGVASPNNKDVSLQLSGQSDLDYGLGIKVADLVESAKSNTYLGELHLIIDACFSGTGAFTGALTLKELGPKTTILTSSSTTQTSFPILLENGTKLSAFTHSLLQAIDSGWSEADDNGDGILRFSEVKTYSFNQLRKWHQQDRITERMQPQLVGGHHEEIILAYKRDKVEEWKSSTREALTFVAVERSLIPTMQATMSNNPQKPEIPEKATQLAEQLTPASDDPYAQGIIAQAKGRLDEADKLFAQAEKLEEEGKEQLAKIYLARGRNETYSGNYKDALPWYQKRVALKPTKDPALLNEFGQAWGRAGQYDEALPFYAEALAIREKTLDPGDPDLAIRLNNLAGLYQKQGKYAEAEPLYQRAIRIDEVAVGPNHPGLATDLNNLAELFRAQGKYAEAEPLYQRALRISETALGPEHPSVAIRLNNLAELFRAQGKYAEAEPLYQRALTINEKALGSEHPHVAVALNNLAELFRAQGKYAEAEPLYQRAIRIDEVAVGPNHPGLATDLNNLAGLYDTQGKYAEAEPLYQRALRISETALGPEHPSVAIRLNNLAALYDSQGKYPEAEPLYLRAYEIFKVRLGLEHPNTKTILNNYADILLKNGAKEKIQALVPDLNIVFPGIFAKDPSSKESLP